MLFRVFRALAFRSRTTSERTVCTCIYNAVYAAIYGVRAHTVITFDRLRSDIAAVVFRIISFRAKQKKNSSEKRAETSPDYEVGNRRR